MRTDQYIMLDMSGDGRSILDGIEFGTTEPNRVSDGFPDDEMVTEDEVIVYGFGSQPFGTTPFGGSTSTETVTRFVYPESYESASYTRKRNDMGSFSVDMPGDRSLLRWTEADAYILDGAGNIKMIGKVRAASHSDAAQVMTLEGVDLLGELERGSAELDVDGRRAYVVFEEYLTEFVPDWDVAVQAPDIEQTSTDKEVQSVGGTRSELESAFDFGETDPFQIVDGSVITYDSAWTTESTEYDSFVSDGEDSDGTMAYHESGSEYSAEKAIRFETDGDTAVYSASPEYTVPTIRVGVRYRCQDAPEVEVIVNNSDPITLCEQGGNEDFRWVDLRQFGSEFSNVSGDTEIRISAVSGPSATGGYVDIDVVAPYDLRYPVTFDNDPDPRVSGPETKPRGAELVTNRVVVDENITAAKVDTDMEPSAFQGIGVSIDEDTYEGNLETDSIDVDLRDSYGYGIETRFRFDRLGERTGKTPTEGFESSELSSWDVAVDTNNLKIIDERALDGTHLENIQWIAERARLSFFGHPTQRRIEAFHRGQKQRELDLGSGDYGDLTTQTSTGAEYANAVTVRGAYADSGERYVGTARNEDEIAELEERGSGDGVVRHVKIDGTITSDSAAQTEAQSILERMVSTREQDGDISGVDPTALPTGMFDPGVEYYISQWDTYSLLNEYGVTQGEVSPEFGELDSDNLIRAIAQNEMRSDEAHRTR